MPPTRGISFLLLVLYGIRIGGEGLHLCLKDTAKGKKDPYILEDFVDWSCVFLVLD